MQSSRIKTVSTLAVMAMACFALTTSANAGIIGQLGILDDAVTPINPATGNPWQAGDTYHLAFSTATLTAANISTDIAFYDAFVQAEVDAAGLGATQGVTWKCIGSTSSVNARDNALVTAPVINMLSKPLASSFEDMWDGTISDLMYTIGGSFPSGGTGYGLIWVGSNKNGYKVANRELGNPSWTYMGDPDKADAWMSYANPKQGSSRTAALYGLSEALKVVGQDFDVTDYIALKTHMGQTTSAGDTEGDFDDNGTVDWDDLQILQDGFRELNAANANPIPEPATLLIMMGAGLPALLRRRRLVTA